MSTTYSDLLYTNYPDTCDTYEYMQDLNSDLLTLTVQYEKLINTKNFAEANQLLRDNPSLNKIYFNAEKYNKLIDSVKAIQRLYFSDIQKYLEQIITYKGDYSNKTAYKKYDVCLYNNGSAYLCISDSKIGSLPTDTSYFVPLTLQGEQGIAGINLTFEGTWDSKVTYSSDSCVTYNNVLYASLVDNNLAKTPSKTSSYWTVVIDFDLLTTYDNSSSGLNSVSLQNAIDEVNAKVNTNKTNIATNTSSISTINTKLNGIESGAQKNTVTGIKGSSESSYRTGNVNITPANLGITVINNTLDSNKSVKYSVTAGSATTASTCTGNSATATSANYATNAGNSDSVDGFHFQLGTTDLTAGSSSLATNVFYFVYE